jgi:myo-inositol-1(or 4)-monophosphatase
LPASDPAFAASVDLKLALNAATAAGRLAMQHFGEKPRYWRKPDGSPVSVVDHQVDELLMTHLRGARPSYGWRSEESDDAMSVLQPSWIVDPIDGTRAFIGGEPQWSICIALVVAGRPVAAVVHAPALRQTFSAVSGRGAMLNAAAITVTGRGELASALVLASRSAFRPERWTTPLPDVEGASPASLALRLCSVAGGNADAALALGYKHDWDLAAGDLIVCEAGGRVSDLAGRPLRYQPSNGRRSGFIAATPAVHEAILAHGPKSTN